MSFKDKSKTEVGRGLLQGMMESAIVQAKSTAYAEELESTVFYFIYFLKLKLVSLGSESEEREHLHKWWLIAKALFARAPHK